MSIINEALKKASRELSPSAPINTSATTSEHYPQQHQQHQQHSQQTVKLWVALGAIGSLLGSVALVLLIVLGVKSTINSSGRFDSPASSSLRAHNATLPTVSEHYISTVKTPRSDPQELLSASREDLSTTVLSGILYVDNERWAVINDEIVRVGDAVGQARLTTINENSVILTVGDNEISLRIK